MEKTYISDLKNCIGSVVKVQGFVENFRNSKKMAFIVLKDITGKVQITVEKELKPELCDTLEKITGDSVITVVGTVREDDYVKLGGMDIVPDEIIIESIADALPIARKDIPATKKKATRIAPGRFASFLAQGLLYRYYSRPDSPHLPRSAIRLPSRTSASRSVPHAWQPAPRIHQRT